MKKLYQTIVRGVNEFNRPTVTLPKNPLLLFLVCTLGMLVAAVIERDAAGSHLALADREVIAVSQFADTQGELIAVLKERLVEVIVAKEALEREVLQLEENQQVCLSQAWNICVMSRYVNALSVVHADETFRREILGLPQEWDYGTNVVFPIIAAIEMMPHLVKEVQDNLTALKANTAFPRTSGICYYQTPPR